MDTSSETSWALVSMTSAVRSPTSTVPMKSWRFTLKRAGTPSRFTTTSPEDGRLPGGRLISMRQSAGPDEANPLNRSRTTPASLGSCVTTVARRPAIPMLSSATEPSAPDAPQSEGERKEQRKQWREKSDRAVSPAGRPGVEPPAPTVPLDRDHLAQDVRSFDELGERERVTLGHEGVPGEPDDAMEEQPARRLLVADHVAHADLRALRGRDNNDIVVPDEGHHAAAPGRNTQMPVPSQHLHGQLIDWTPCRHHRKDLRTRARRSERANGAGVAPSFVPAVSSGA